MSLARIPLGSALIAGAVVAVAAGQQPATEKRPVKDTYHDVTVVDDYRWLENWDDPAVKTWSDAQNAHARTVLDAAASVKEIRQRITELYGGASGHSRGAFRAGRYFFIKREPSRDQPRLVVLSSPASVGSERVVVDPLAIDPMGGTSMDWYVPSPDGSKVAVSLSEGGSERGNVHVFDVATGKEAGEVIERVNYGTAGGSLSWAGDSSGVYYSRYPRPGERPTEDLDFYTQVYYHALGTPVASDRYEIGKEFPRIAEIFLTSSDDGRYVLANVANGDGGEFAQFLRQPSGTWLQLTTFKDKVVHGVFGDDAALYLLSRNGAPRGKVLRLPLNGDITIKRASVVVPESADAVVGFNFYGSETLVATKSRLYVVDLVGGPNRVRMFTPTGAPLGTLPLPPVSAVDDLVRVGGDEVLYRVATYIDPPAWFSFDPATIRKDSPEKLVISSTAGATFADAEVVRVMATSKDGTQVPMNIIRRKGTVLNGRNPTLLTGYGGYGISNSPSFLGEQRLWLEQGGVIVVANIRGGGEFGEAWHLAGNLTKKQRVFDDLIACAEELIKLRYTSAQHLAIEGGSNGGLLMGAALTQRPDLFKAVVSHVGFYDMLRAELSPNGAFNVPEFGTVKDSDQFAAMYTYSPYHRVKDGTRYPSVLFLTGTNDPRVDPMHSRKMTARLQAATSGSDPILLRTSSNSGHGFGTALTETINQDVDLFAFLFTQLGMQYKQPVK